MIRRGWWRDSNDKGEVSTAADDLRRMVARSRPFQWEESPFGEKTELWENAVVEGSDGEMSSSISWTLALSLSRFFISIALSCVYTRSTGSERGYINDQMQIDFKVYFNDLDCASPKPIHQLSTSHRFVCRPSRRLTVNMLSLFIHLSYAHNYVKMQPLTSWLFWDGPLCGRRPTAATESTAWFVVDKCNR